MNRAGGTPALRGTALGVACAVLLLTGMLQGTARGTGHGGRQLLRYRTAWIGNSFGGGPKWVQNFIEGLAVTADGTVICASTWDEAGREYGFYRDGEKKETTVTITERPSRMGRP